MAISKRNVRIPVKVTRELHAVIQAEAAKLDVSMSGLVEQILIEFFDRDEPQAASAVEK